MRVVQIKCTSSTDGANLTLNMDLIPRATMLTLDQV